jgi:TolB-like protein/DNA-binding winged helix-turn-helix (wHTH) protein/Tfp pilus assembly protein PilF
MGRQVRFDRFRFDPETARLWAGAQEIRLTPKSGAVMAVLIAHAGEPVSKEALFAAVWPDTTVSDDALTTCVAELRRALEDDAKQPRFIETRHRRGYRFTAPLSPVEETVVSAPPQAAAGSATAPDQPATGRQRRARWIVGGAVAALVALLIARAPALLNSGGTRLSIRSLAVLPLANLTGDPEQDYFSDGMTDALITNLASLPTLKVISRQSVMRYKDSPKSLPEIARELGVEGVVEGSVARSGGRVRITAQLVHAATDRHLWAHSYERPLEDVLALQGELARAIAEAVHVTVGAKEGRRLAVQRTVNPKAYDAYLLGRHQANLRTGKGLDRALGHFREAVASDPDFALAHAGLALAYGPRQVYAYVPPGTGLAEMKAAALKAVELDPGLGDARAALGAVRLIEWDWDGAEAELRTALELDPSSSVGHGFMAWNLRSRGLMTGALRHHQRALEQDPLSLLLNQGVALTLAAAGRDEAALAQWERALEIEPDHSRTHLALALFHFERGRSPDGARHLEHARSLEHEGPLELASLALACAAGGEGHEARRLLHQLQATSARRYVSPVLPAMTHAALGENDRAFALLDEARAARDPALISIKVGDIGVLLHLARAHLAALRADPRFDDLLRRMGVPPGAPPS